jgi:hypothetical protein
MNKPQNHNQKQGYSECNSYIIEGCYSLSRLISEHFYQMEMRFSSN